METWPTFCTPPRPQQRRHHEATLRKLKDLKSSGSTIPLMTTITTCIFTTAGDLPYDNRPQSFSRLFCSLLLIACSFLPMHRAFYLGCVMTIPTTSFVSRIRSAAQHSDGLKAFLAMFISFFSSRGGYIFGLKLML